MQRVPTFPVFVVSPQNSRIISFPLFFLFFLYFPMHKILFINLLYFLCFFFFYSRVVGK